MKQHKRTYAPVVQVGKRWVRATYPRAIATSTLNPRIVCVDLVPLPAFTKDYAVRYYQDWLLAPYLQGVQEHRELRPSNPCECIACTDLRTGGVTFV